MEDVVDYRSPDRLSILTYVSQFYHKFSYIETDSGISSLNQSPVSSDSEVEASVSLSSKKRGAIMSLMEGDRGRSTPSNTRRRARSEGRRLVCRPIERENPFTKDIQNMRQSGIDIALHDSSVKMHSIDKCKSESTEETMVRNIYKQSSKDFSGGKCVNSTTCSTLLPLTFKPNPYSNLRTQGVTSILSETQLLIKEQKLRSKSQPPHKQSKDKFEFLSTNKYLNKPSYKTVEQSKTKQKIMSFPCAFRQTLV